MSRFAVVATVCLCLFLFLSLAVQGSLFGPRPNSPPLSASTAIQKTWGAFAPVEALIVLLHLRKHTSILSAFTAATASAFHRFLALPAALFAVRPLLPPTLFPAAHPTMLASAAHALLALPPALRAAMGGVTGGAIMVALLVLVGWRGSEMDFLRLGLRLRPIPLAWCAGALAAGFLCLGAEGGGAASHALPTLLTAVAAAYGAAYAGGGLLTQLLWGMSKPYGRYKPAAAVLMMVTAALVGMAAMRSVDRACSPMCSLLPASLARAAEGAYQAMGTAYDSLPATLAPPRASCSIPSKLCSLYTLELSAPTTASLAASLLLIALSLIQVSMRPHNGGYHPDLWTTYGASTTLALGAAWSLALHFGGVTQTSLRDLLMPSGSAPRSLTLAVWLACAWTVLATANVFLLKTWAGAPVFAPGAQPVGARFQPPHKDLTFPYSFIGGSLLHGAALGAGCPLTVLGGGGGGAALLTVAGAAAGCALATAGGL